MVATKPVDFRKGHDGLAALVKNELHKDPFTGTVFVFRSRKADRLKLIYWDGSGLVMTYKRAGGAHIHLARHPGRSDDFGPCPVRGAVCGARLAAGPLR
jgi:transposase